MKINLGAGGTKLDGFVTLDYDPLENPDYIVDLEKDTLPFEDSTVEVVIAHHILDRHDYFYDDPTHRRPITVGGLLLFSKKHNKLCREQGAASSRLGDYFKVDFEILDYNYMPSQQYRDQFVGEPRDVVEKYLREHNNIIEELWVNLVVIKDEHGGK